MNKKWRPSNRAEKRSHAFGANPALSPKYTEAARPLTAPFTNDRLYLIRESSYLIYYVQETVP